MSLLELVSTGVSLEAADGDQPRRVLAGLAVPYNTVARVLSGQRVKFLPGSLPLDGPAPKVLRGHDRGHPVGLVTHRSADAAGVQVRARISAVPAGDEVLTLAADGVLDAWSVGAEPLDYTFEQDDAGDVMVVARADWQEISVLPFGAFPTARITEISATRPPEDPMSILSTDGPAPTVDAAPDPAPQVITPTRTPAPTVTPAPAPTVQASPYTPGARPQIFVQANTLSLAGLAGLIAAANRGEVPMEQAKPRIQAALANVITSNIASVVMPGHLAEITGLIDWGRPLINAIASAPLPASGTQIEYPAWNILPSVGAQTPEKTAVTSTAASLQLKTAPVVTWAGANDISLQAVERSSPSFLDAYLRAMAVDYAKKTDTYACTALLAAAAVVAPATSFVTNVAALIGALDPATTPPGPLVLGLSWDIAASLIGVTQQNGPAFWSGSISFGGQLPEVNAGGLAIFTDPNLPVKTYLLGAQSGAVWYESPGAPADIRVVDVSLLGLDVGVYGYGALTIPWPGSWKKMTLP